MTSRKSVVIVGGGTGTHTILRGLKRHAGQLDITAIVNMSDSGGSTGRLRDEFGMLPVGDVRMALAALAVDDTETELLMRDLFLYRFKNGDSLKGHNLGNLLLTALSDLLGGEAAAIAAASKILRVAGMVLPVTNDNVHLRAEYDDGVVLEGEHNIDTPPSGRAGHRIVNLSLTPEAQVNREAAETLRKAEVIVIGPGDLYSSLLANCVVSGVAEAVRDSQARLVYISNLMERMGQTDGMSVSDCVSEIYRYAGRAPDVVLVNDAPLPEEMVLRYQKEEGTKPVVDDADQLPFSTVVRADLISNAEFTQNSADQVRRSLIRHDPDKLAAAIMAVENSKSLFI